MSAAQLEGAVAFHCIVCGPVIRENFHDGTSITYHKAPLSALCAQANKDEDKPQ